jgi:membrane-associated protein
MPIVRTFCPPVAGAAEMHYTRYLLYDIAGGCIWVGTTILGGYFLASLVPNISEKIHYVIAVVIVLSFLPPVIGVWKARSRSTGGPGTPPAGQPQRTSSAQ